MSKLENMDEFSDLLAGYNPTFTQGFANRVMDEIELLKEDNSTSKYIEFYNIYRWIAFSGVAAIIILLFSVYLTEGSFTTDAFYGLANYTPDEPIITSLNY